MNDSNLAITSRNENFWEQRKLNEATTRILRKNKNLISKRPLTISAQYGLIDQQAFFNKQVASSNLENYLLLEKGEFAYNKSYSDGFPYGTIKKLNLYDNGAVSTLYIAFKANADINSDFLENLFSSNKWNNEVYKIAAEGARNHGLLNISPDDFFNIKITISKDSQEQAFISKFLRVFDNLLALYERKLKLLSQVKKYFLDNLFAEKESPNLRFKGYEDTWLKSKFSKFLSIPEKEKVTIDSPSRILTVKLNLGGVQKGANRTTLKLNSTTYYLRKAGQLIYGKQNLFNGSLAIIPPQFEGYVTSGDVPSLNIDNINKQFLYYYIARKSFYEKTEAYSSGTGSKRIHEKTFLSFNIVYPENLKEQEKISRLISSINSNIKLYCSKKNKLTAIKKKLLNTMFI